MLALPKPEVILTHESDLDGLVAGVLLRRLARKLFGAEIPLQAWHYNAWRQREPRENAAWIADLSFEPRLDKVNWVIVDHHQTDATPRNAKLIHNLEKSAGLLCYELCQEAGLGSPALDRLVRLNDVADLFLDDDPEFVLATDVANLVKTYGFWNLHSLLGGEIEKLLDHPLLEVMAVKRRIEDPMGFEWARGNIAELSSTVGLVQTVVGNVNLIVHRLLEEGATPYPVLMTAYKRSNGIMILSLRSRGGEAIKVAELLKGGGHANACGAALPKSVKNLDEAIGYLRQVLNPSKVSTGLDAPLNSLEGLFAGIEVKKS
jgi:hypothetical protein